MDDDAVLAVRLLGDERTDPMKQLLLNLIGHESCTYQPKYTEAVVSFISQSAKETRTLNGTAYYLHQGNITATAHCTVRLLQTKKSSMAEQ